MSHVIAYDLVRLFIGPLFATPRGIDRVDLALAQHIFADSSCPHIGILPTPWGVRAIPAASVKRALTHLLGLWSETTRSSDDPQLRALTEHIRSPASPSIPAPPQRHTLTTNAWMRRMFDHVMATGLQLGSSAERSVPEDAVYLNVGQIGLAVPMFHNWLERRPDVTCMVMLHDVIPLEYPHLVIPGSVAHHARMVETASRHADYFLFNTASARDSVNTALSRLGRERVPGLVRSLPLPAAYFHVERSLPELEHIRYFVAVSSIEPRKNYELLFRVWERLIEYHGVLAPHLVIVGSPGYQADRILSALDGHPLLRSRVHHVSGLSSSGLAALVLGAAGMLCPSLAEGFGLPVLEANAMGVPTIASDIAAHREVANDSTVLLAADDVSSWERAVRALPRAGKRSRPSIPADLAQAAYCADVVGFLDQIVGSTKAVRHTSTAELVDQTR